MDSLDTGIETLVTSSIVTGVVILLVLALVALVARSDVSRGNASKCYRIVYR